MNYTADRDGHDADSLENLISMVHSQFDTVDTLFSTDQENTGDTADLESEKYTKIQKDGDIYIATLEDGDTFTQILKEIGVSNQHSHLLAIKIDKLSKLSKLKSNEEIRVTFQSKSGTALNHKQPIERLIIDLPDIKVQADYNTMTKDFDITTIPIVMQLQRNIAIGKITNSFLAAAQSGGASRNIAMEFVNIFSHEIDFQRDLTPGSSFKMLYETQVTEKGKKIKDGKILYASLSTQNKDIEIYQHVLADGSIGYFHKDGSSIKKALLKTPVRGGSVSAGYGMRTHPILGYSRMHRGLDYAAPRGTPVIAAGDGTVEIIRLHNSYGKYIKIKHNTRYSTLYAHLDRFSSKLKAGGKVSQGDVIGYVGSTGLSTGPHLHYEVHIDGKQINPAKITIKPSSLALHGQQLVAFREKLDRIHKMLKDDVSVSMLNHMAHN